MRTVNLSMHADMKQKNSGPSCKKFESAARDGKAHNTPRSASGRNGARMLLKSAGDGDCRKVQKVPLSLLQRDSQRGKVNEDSRAAA